MSLIKRSDVKSHLRPPFPTRIHLVQPESQPDATGFSGDEPDPIKANPSYPGENSIAEHSSSGLAVASTGRMTGSRSTEAPTVSNSVQP